MSAPHYDLSAPLGLEFPLSPISWNNRDLLLYAVSIGSSKSDLDVIYELDPNYSAFPTYPVVFPFKGDATDVVNFVEKFGNVPPIPGLPTFDASKLVQGSQFLEVLKPLPRVSGTGWMLTRKIVGIHENSQGIAIDYEQIILDPTSVPYARLITVGLNLGAVANGVPFDKTTSVGITRSVAAPGTTVPSWMLKETTLENQSDLYRLNGDYNPLHIDPSVGVKLGYGGLILHGLLVYAIAVRSILTNFAKGDTKALKAVFADFSGPVTPGDTIQIKVWKLGPGPTYDGISTTELAFEAYDSKTNALALGGGVAHVVVSEEPAHPTPIALSAGAWIKEEMGKVLGSVGAIAAPK